MGSLAIAALRLSDINWQNHMRKLFVSFLSLSNLSGGFPSSHPHFGWSEVVCRSAIPKGLSPVPFSCFPLAIDDHSGIASSFSISDQMILLALEGGWLCLHISAGVGSPLSTRTWRSIPW